MIDESRGPALLMAAYFLTVAAWTFSNPPGAAPDEAAHYIRAAAASSGDFLPDRRPSQFTGGETSTPIRWMLKQARLVALPASISPETFRCRGIPGRLAPCNEKAPGRGAVEELTYVGTYPPTPYLVPAAFMSAASSSDEALYLARAGSALVCWLLLALALAAVWDRRSGWVSVWGTTIAISPMVIYMASSLSGSGLETAAAICFLASLLRLTREPDRPGRAGPAHPGWVWAAAGVSGAILASSRDLGLVWLALHLAIFAGWMGIRPARAAIRSGGRGALAAVAAVSVSVALSIAWQVMVQVRPPFALGAWLEQITPSFGFYVSAVRQQIGVFGPLDTVMPVIAYAGWLALTLMIFALAVFAGDLRRRLLVAGTVIATAAMAVALDAVQRTVGFGIQGRYLLPIAVAIPMVAGETLSRRPAGLRWLTGRLASLPATGVVASILLLGWYTIGRRYSVGLRGPLLFFDGSVWAPPLGWMFWGAAASAGALLVVSFGLLCPLRVSGQD